MLRIFGQKICGILSFLTKDHTHPPCIGRQSLTTGPPGMSQPFLNVQKHVSIFPLCWFCISYSSLWDNKEKVMGSYLDDQKAYTNLWPVIFWGPLWMGFACNHFWVTFISLPFSVLVLLLYCKSNMCHDTCSMRLKNYWLIFFRNGNWGNFPVQPSFLDEFLDILTALQFPSSELCPRSIYLPPLLYWAEI